MRKDGQPLNQEKTLTGFENMDLSTEIMKAVEKMGFHEATPIQQKTIPVMMEGHDVIGIAPTGTGKTCAFGIPMLEYISLTDTRIQELVLAPTRELAVQIGQEMEKLAAFIPEVRIAVLYGGQPISKQLNQLKKKPQIIVATPGRMLDHMQRGTARLNAVHTMVIDEADEMLKMGFVKDVCKIIEAVPTTRQLVMFSATTNQDVLTISWKYQHDPVEITIPATKENKPQITQYVIPTTREEKYDQLLYLLDSDVYGRIMIFTNTKDMCRRLSERLNKAGYDTEALHGDIPQSKRNQVMAGFKRGKFPILVCTDVAARGIDVDDVEAVINYDLPNENEYYIHRIGRTGRAKKHGVAFTLLSFSESVRLDEILKYVQSQPTYLKFDDMGVLRYQESKEAFFEDI
ncbi:MAG: DEAD/DEAH box helicase [Clostridia bacterium]|nr:DEAD/DEAH box helicase [Clostridia bacterium]